MTDLVNLEGVETAEVHFAVLRRIDRDPLVIALADFDGVTRVGCGPDEKTAVENLFTNALGKTPNYTPQAAMQASKLKGRVPVKK